MKPLFMWAGGKTKLIDKFEPHLPSNFDTYIEPFFGGGAMFIRAYAQNPEANFIINDLNQHIMDIYLSIKLDVHQFLLILDSLEQEYLVLDPPTYKIVEESNGKKKTKWIPHPKGKPDKNLEKSRKLPGNQYDWAAIHQLRPTRRSFYFKCRAEYQENLGAWSRTKRSAWLYFLMKTGFNGVWQAKSQRNSDNNSNIYNTPCGLMRHTNSIYDKQNVLVWHKALSKTKILSLDFLDTIPYCEANSFIYLDPPYRGSFADYNTRIDDCFQESVIQYLEDAKQKGSFCLLSNRDLDDGFFEERKGNNEIVRFDVTYTVGRKKKVENGHKATKAKEILMISRR